MDWFRIRGVLQCYLRTSAYSIILCKLKTGLLRCVSSTCDIAVLPQEEKNGSHYVLQNELINSINRSNKMDCCYLKLCALQAQ